MDAGQPPDAVEMPLAPHRNDQIKPHHAACWIRIGGQWRKGWVHHWLVGTTGWLAWTQWDDESPWPRFGMYAYDPESIRPRAEGEGPPIDGGHET